MSVLTKKIDVLTKKDRKHIEQNFHSIAWVMSQGWDLGCWGSKTLAWGFAMAPPLTARSSLFVFFILRKEILLFTVNSRFGAPLVQ